MGHAERRYQAAYYVAEAGIRHQIEHMRLRMEELHYRQPPQPTITDLNTFFNTFNAQPGLTAETLILRDLGNDVARADITMNSIQIAPDNSRTYTFTSLGMVGNVRRSLQGSVTILWARIQPPAVFFQRAVHTYESLRISGNPTIIGGVSTNAAQVSISGNPNITGGIHTNMNLPTPAIVLPSGLPLRNNLDVRNNATVTINANGRYDAIEVNGTLRFDLSAGDLQIQVTRLTMNSGTIETFGGGRLYLFVNGNLALSGNDNINEGRASHMLMFVTGDSIAISGDAKFSGGLYAPNATLKITGRGNFTGALMVDSADISGNPEIRHATTTEDGISSFLGPIPGHIPPEHMFIVNPWREP